MHRFPVTRRRLAGLLVSAAAASVLLPAGTAYAADSGPEGVTAKGAYLLDGESGEELWSKDAGTARQMASTTKIMTAVVALRAPGALDKQITVKQEYRDYVAREGASTADLQTGDKLTVGQVLYGLMLPSGCDAAYAIADALGSGETVKERTDSFIRKMNQTADDLGLKNTQFDSFDGISQAGDNYTTPADLAKLTRHALEDDTFRTVVSTQTATEEATNGRVYTWYNTNQLLGSYDGAIGVKTGTGTAAGACLVFAAERDGRLVIGVVLGAPSTDDRYADAVRMLDWAYGTESTVKLRTLPQDAQRD